MSEGIDRRKVLQGIVGLGVGAVALDAKKATANAAEVNPEQKSLSLERDATIPKELAEIGEKYKELVAAFASGDKAHIEQLTNELEALVDKTKEIAR